MLVAPQSDVILITLHSYLACHSFLSLPVSFMFLTLADSIFPSFLFFHQLTACLHLLRPLPHAVLLSDSYPAAVLSRPPQLSGVQLITSTMLSVTDSWVKWLWQHAEAWRIHFQAAPESVLAPICQPKTGARTISHS